MARRYLVVGAGFAGAVVARELAEAGDCTVEVIDSRDHIGGNAFDRTDPETGIRVHVYGPHIFHTSDQTVVDWLSRFTAWLPYRHRVEALVEGHGHVPLPPNRTTLRRLTGLPLPDEAAVRAYLDSVRSRHLQPRNARESAENVYGPGLTELFFARYTRTMWGIALDDLPAAVLARLPVRHDDRDEYFDDTFQAMPRDGYTAMFGRMLDHPAIRVDLSTPWRRGLEDGYDHAFLSLPIDAYFAEAHGPLPYRSIRFHHQRVAGHRQPVPTVNFTDGGRFTRRTDWRLYPGHGGGETALLTTEEPCSYEDNGFERYYPVKTVDGVPQARYERYRAMAAGLDRVTFIGRCGQYRYYDMHQVVANSRQVARGFIGRRSA